MFSLFKIWAYHIIWQRDSHRPLFFQTRFLNIHFGNFFWLKKLLQLAAIDPDLKSLSLGMGKSFPTTTTTHEDPDPCHLLVNGWEGGSTYSGFSGICDQYWISFVNIKIIICILLSFITMVTKSFRMPCQRNWQHLKILQY